jgi:imidazole glycerol-phosphate synthase
MRVSVVDYGAGNVASLLNALAAIGCEVDIINTADEITNARVLIFPGVGSFGACMEVLEQRGWMAALRAYVRADKPYFGICLGMQTLFEASEESPGIAGLGLLPGTIARFKGVGGRAVPQIGWNTVHGQQPSHMLEGVSDDDAVYFVHSFRAGLTAALEPWALTTTDYGEKYVSSVQRGRVVACQFHPEKSGAIGLRILSNFVRGALADTPARAPMWGGPPPRSATTKYCKRVIACMDVRANDAGDLVCTKGDQYDVREKSAAGGGAVRNLGKPVVLAKKYYEQGADEITFLNITGFRDCPLSDTPMIDVIREASKEIFVPLTVGGGIRGFVDANGVSSSALEVANAYFRAGADKISIGSDAVDVAREYLRTKKLDGSTSIEQISHVYGRQAVVVSVDPRRRWITSRDAAQGHAIVDHSVAPLSCSAPGGLRGPQGETLCWYECTVQGGRKGSDIDVVQLATAVEALGCGELLVNCIDHDGQNDGYDLGLLKSIREAVSIPVIASSGAGNPQHFVDVFRASGVEAGLAASIFHKNIVTIAEVKAHLERNGISVRATHRGASATGGFHISQWVGMPSARTLAIVAGVFALGMSALMLSRR